MLRITLKLITLTLRRAVRAPIVWWSCRKHQGNPFPMQNTHPTPINSVKMWVPNHTSVLLNSLLCTAISVEYISHVQ